MFGRDAQRGQRKAGGTGAADIAAFEGMQAAIRARAIACDAAVRIGLFPEVEKAASGEIVEQPFVFNGERPACAARQSGTGKDPGRYRKEFPTSAKPGHRFLELSILPNRDQMQDAIYVCSYAA